jgi:hypothetical protein
MRYNAAQLSPVVFVAALVQLIAACAGGGEIAGEPPGDDLGVLESQVTPEGCVVNASPPVAAYGWLIGAADVSAYYSPYACQARVTLQVWTYDHWSWAVQSAPVDVSPGTSETVQVLDGCEHSGTWLRAVGCVTDATGASVCDEGPWDWLAC